MNNVQVISLKDFFKEVNYDYENDKEVIGEICRLTKTRVKDIEFDKEKLHDGMEQPFLLKAITDWVKPKNVLEIGTGRGTGSYSMALTESVDCIVTMDIIPVDRKQQTAIGFKQAHVSNSDLFLQIDIKEKEKIVFRHVDEDISICKNYFGDFQLSFIDGDHTNISIIEEDYNKSKSLLGEEHVILWDDYNPNKFSVKEVADKIKERDGYNSLLIEFRGHLFGDDKEKDSGILLMKKGDIL